MASDQVKLLRRPLPPKKTILQPILKPAPTPLLSDAVVESVSSVVCKATDKSECSCETPPWDFDPYAFGATPTLPVLIPASPETPHKITNSFPFRPPRTLAQSHFLDLLRDHPRFARPPPCFCLNDFLEAAQSVHELAQPSQSLRKMVLSRCNYRKLVDLFLSELHCGHQREVASQILSCEELPPAKRRIPQRQIIYELAALVRMEQQVLVQRRSNEPFSLFEQNSAKLWTLSEKFYPVNEVILNSAPVKHFQGSLRSRSPFQPAAECEMISPTELAVLECLTQNGKTLSLKAHFIAELPDLSPLVQSLLYLNLSFNDFTVFPVGVCELAQLEVLKLRDNPIQEIPPDIEKLFNLKTLVISFCKLTTLPSRLYHLPSLLNLDVSHNLISSLCSEIKNLRSLQYLNVEGNQLVALPAGLLSLSLSELRLAGNYTHPLLWTINSVNSPPSLSHTAALTLALTHPERDYSSLPPEGQLALSRPGVCECCGGPQFGPGLKLICPVHNLFGLHSVPIAFLSCSASCYSNFRYQTHSLRFTRAKCFTVFLKL